MDNSIGRKMFKYRQSSLPFGAVEEPCTQVTGTLVVS
jgi:hypothetical protein